MGATREGRRRGEAEGGTWAETPPLGHVTQPSAPALGQAQHTGERTAELLQGLQGL